MKTLGVTPARYGIKAEPDEVWRSNTFAEGRERQVTSSPEDTEAPSAA